MTKNGLAWSNIKASPSPADDARTLMIDWFHRWSLRSGNITGGVAERIQHFNCDTDPALAQGAFIKTDNYQKLNDIESITPDFSGFMLFINEPDRWDQCEGKPRATMEKYRALIHEVPNALILGPQVSHEDYLGLVKDKNTNNKDDHTPKQWWWMRKFFDQLVKNDLPFPYGAGLHTYLSEAPSKIVDSYLSMCAEYDYIPAEIWITEFAVTTVKQLRRMVEYYRRNPLVTRYAYYGVRQPTPNSLHTLFGEDGELSDIGREWVRLHE